MQNNLNLLSVSDDMLSILDGEYRGQLAEGNLPSIKNNHEAYGIAAERYAAVVETMAAMKRSMADALKVLPGPNDDGAFFAVCESLYDACVGVAANAARMAVQMQNIIHQTAPYENQYVGTTPLEALAGGGMDAETDESMNEEE